MERFFNKIDKTESCWNWTAGKRGKTGYGAFRMGDKVVDAHRVSFKIHKGDIPSGMLICHTCDNRLCVNPDHLFLGTYKDNHQDAVNKGRIVLPNLNEKFIVPHGNSAYKKGCRCSVCKDLHNTYLRKYRASKKANT